jgi:hypothetical protein
VGATLHMCKLQQEDKLLEAFKVIGAQRLSAIAIPRLYLAAQYEHGRAIPLDIRLSNMHPVVLPVLLAFQLVCVFYVLTSTCNDAASCQGFSGACSCQWLS